jgi:hypothetical protein
MNLANLARAVTDLEGGAVNQSIAQISETIRAIRVVAASLPDGERRMMAAQLTTAPKPKRDASKRGGAR